MVAEPKGFSSPDPGLGGGVANLATRMDGAIRDMRSEDNALRTRLDGAMTNIETELSNATQRITHTETAVQGLTAADIGVIQGVVAALAGHDVPTITGQLTMVSNALHHQGPNLQGLQAQFATHQLHMGVIQGEIQKMMQEQSQTKRPKEAMRDLTNPYLSIVVGRTWTS